MKGTRSRALILAVFAVALLVAPHGDTAGVKRYEIELASPPPGFHDRMAA